MKKVKKIFSDMTLCLLLWMLQGLFWLIIHLFEDDTLEEWYKEHDD